MSDNNKLPTKDSLGRRSRSGMRTRYVDIDKVHKKLMTVLDRQADHLLRKSVAEILSRDDMTGLTSSLKLIKELRNIEKEKKAELTDKELEEISQLKELEESEEN